MPKKHSKTLKQSRKTTEQAEMLAYCKAIYKKNKGALSGKNGYFYFNLDYKKLHSTKPEYALRLVKESDFSLINFFERMIQEQWDADDADSFSVRLTNFPKEYSRTPKELRVDDIGKYRLIQGTVTMVLSIRPDLIRAKFECPQCGKIITVKQTEATVKEPCACTCGRKGRFRLFAKNLTDSQTIGLKDINNEELGIYLTKDLVNDKVKIGDKIQIIGKVEASPRKNNAGENICVYNFYIEANNWVKNK